MATKSTRVSTVNVTTTALTAKYSFVPPAESIFCTVTVCEATAGSGNRVIYTEDGAAPVAGTIGGALSAGVYEFHGELGKLVFDNETTDGCYLYIVYRK